MQLFKCLRFFFQLIFPAILIIYFSPFFPLHQKRKSKMTEETKTWKFGSNVYDPYFIEIMKDS